VCSRDNDIVANNPDRHIPALSFESSTSKGIPMHFLERTKGGFDYDTLIHELVFVVSMQSGHLTTCLATAVFACCIGFGQDSW